MTLNSIAVLAYLGTAFLCVLASWKGAALRRHSLLWLSAGTIFMAVACTRLTGGEEFLRTWLRSYAASAGSYGSRWELQAPVTVLVIVLAAGAVLMLARTWQRSSGRREKLLLAGVAFAAAYLPLYAIRIVSLHATDLLLYYGPAPLNWILDGLLCLGSASCAAGYIHRHSSRMRAQRPS